MTSRVLVTGATGYIGGRLVPDLLAAGHAVRCLARSPAKLEGLATAAAATRGARPHGGGRLPGAAAGTGVGQIIYLGRLGADDDPDLSPHLRSRHEVGRVLAEGPVPVTELRAAIIIGSGSASFEMPRSLTEVLPVMVTPTWVSTRCQPIAIRDVLYYLVGVLGRPEARGRVLEVGGPDVMSYLEVMQAYAEVARLRRRLVLRLPVLTPNLSSHWVGLVTPIPTGLAKPLIGSLLNEVVVRDPASAPSCPVPPCPSGGRSSWPSNARRTSTWPPPGPGPSWQAAPLPRPCPPTPTGPEGRSSRT